LNRKVRAAVLLVLSGVAVGGCTPVQGNAREVTVFAAASLGATLEAVQGAYEASHDVDVVVSTDSSATLATQIEQGAPADVFLSADLATPERLVDGGFAVGGVVPFADNRLTAIVPADDRAGIASPADLARPGVRVIAAGAEVPITRYAAELVANLGSLPGYGADYASAYERNVVSREDSVAAVVTRIELGAGDAAIVYATDAGRSRAVREVEVPAAATVRATYGGVVLATSGARRDGAGREAAAQAFLAWLVGREGQQVLADFGFLPPGP
jgi:molybdate transport system substrate-binding protein